MKRILLTSTALVMTAGIAAADVSFSGTAKLGFNDTDHATGASGGDFYVDGDLNISMSQELDNGMTAGADFEIDYWGGGTGGALSSSDSVVYLKSDTAGLYYGDTSRAAEKHWASAGDMETDGFSSGSSDAVLRGDLSFGDTNVSLSVIDGNNTNTEQLSLGVSGTAGSFSYALGYQEEATMNFNTVTGTGYCNGTVAGAGPFTCDSGDFNYSEIFGVSVGMTFGGADVRLAYSSNETSGQNSTGIKVGYAVSDAVKVTAYYVAESATAGDNFGLNVAYSDGPIAVALDYQDDQGTQKVALDGSYDLGNGMTIYAGASTNDGGSDHQYVGVSYDLGGGASALFSYATDPETADGDDEIGPKDYKEGMTIEVSFAF